MKNATKKVNLKLQLNKKNLLTQSTNVKNLKVSRLKNSSYKTKKSDKKHKDKMHDNLKSYYCDTCEDMFTDKSEFDKLNSERKHHQDTTAIQISGMTVQKVNIISVKMTPVTVA